MSCYTVLQKKQNHNLGVFLSTSRNPVSVLLSDPGVYDEIMQPVLHSGYLYKSGLVHRGTLSRKTREGKGGCSVFGCV